MNQEFSTEELKGELERGLGFRLRSLTRLDGASALNFKAVRETDGLAFAVKCAPARRRDMFDHLVRHLEETRGTKAVTRLFAETCPATFRGYSLICQSWCEGQRLFPDQLTESQLVEFLDEYLRFSEVMQKATLIAPPDPIADWRAAVLDRCTGLCGRWMRRLVERALPKEETAYRKDRLQVIHGDFHHGNFLFADGHLAGFFDLEEFCYGYPADDIVRYFVCAAEHLKWYERGRERRILARFETAVSRLPYPEDEWLTAIDGLLARKIYKKTHNVRLWPWRVLNLLFRARLYLRLKQIVRRCCVADLRRFLDERLGCRLAGLVPLNIVCAAKVFRAVSADGRVLFVKLSRNDGKVAAEFLSRHAGHPLLPESLLKRPVAFGDRWVSVYVFRRIAHARLDEMTDAQFKSFCAGCREVFGLMRNDVDLSGRRDYDACLNAARSLYERGGCVRPLLRPLVGLTRRDYMYPPGTDLQLVHWDFTPKNFGFDGETLSAVIDFDDLDAGSPAEPLVYLAAQSLRYRSVRRSRKVRQLLVRRLQVLRDIFGRPEAEWVIACQRTRLRDALFAFEKHPGGGMRTALNLWRRDRWLRWLLGQIRKRA